MIKMITGSERYTEIIQFNTSGSETKEKKEERRNEEEVGDDGTRHQEKRERENTSSMLEF